MSQIAALYVMPRGVYYGLPGIEPWGLPELDARLYAGPHPVVAHPPCSRWCRLAGLVQARWGHKRGDDGGCFAAALAAVRRWGGVLEHPAYSAAWAAYGLTHPSRLGGWTPADMAGGWTCHVEQWHYGHPAKKATWLYAVVPPESLPSLRWGSAPDGAATAYVTDGRGDARRRGRPLALVSWCGNKTAADEIRPRLSKRAASSTPLEFRDVLIGIARSAVEGSRAAGRQA